MNIIFAGTPHFALPSLDAIANSGHHITTIYTQPDRPAGRGHKLSPSPVKEWALMHDIPLQQPLNFKSQESIDTLKLLKPDIMVVIAYGLILPRAVLEIPRYGCINVHASLLPRWRGASPIQQAILHNDTSTGVTIMQMDAGMDTGNMLATVSCPITSQDTAGTLHDKLSYLSTEPLLDVLGKITKGDVVATPQDNQFVTYAPKITKENAAIKWTQSASEIDCQIRAFNPWPICYTHINQDTIRIHHARPLEGATHKTPGTILSIEKEGIQVATGKGILLIEQLQFAGGKALSVRDWLNAYRAHLQTGDVLS